MSGAQELGTILAQKVHAACAGGSAIQQVSKQEMHGPEIGQFEPLDLNLGGARGVVFLAEQCLDSLDREEVLQPDKLVLVAHPEPTVTI